MAMALAGCGASRDACPRSPTVQTGGTEPLPEQASATPAASAADYGPVFDALASQIEALHVFGEGRRGFWDAHKAVLRGEMAAAHTRREALAALRDVELAL